MEMPNLKLPDLSSIVTPPPFIPSPDLKITRIVSAIDNIQNINRLRDIMISDEKKSKEKRIFKGTHCDGSMCSDGTECTDSCRTLDERGR